MIALAFFVAILLGIIIALFEIFVWENREEKIRGEYPFRKMGYIKKDTKNDNQN